MDTTKAITHISLCTGYGGIDLGLKRAIPNLRSIALCEIEAFAIANLVSKMEAGLLDPAPIWSDLKTFPWESFRDRVDILTGGYPCQPFSSAGRRLGKYDPRHLWPWIAIGIQTLRPRFCFFENVEGHITLGLSSVISDLEEMGYRCAWGIFSAAEVGAPHQRKRVFILAHCSDYRSEIRHLVRSCSQGKTGDALPCGKTMADSTSVGFDGCLSDRKAVEQTGGGSVEGVCAWPSRPGEQQHGWEPPRVVADSHRIDRSAQAEGREHDRQVGSTGEKMGDSESGTRFRDAQREAGHAAQSDQNMGNSESGNGEGEQLHLRQRQREHRGTGGCFDSIAQSVKAMGDSDHGRQPSGLNTGGCTEANRGRQGDVEQTDGSMGDTAIQGSQERSQRSIDSSIQTTQCGSGGKGNRQTQPPLGGDFDGDTCGMDYAELCVSSDNRTDELRLLGNGVVPATASVAFRTLMQHFQ